MSDRLLPVKLNKHLHCRETNNVSTSAAAEKFMNQILFLWKALEGLLKYKDFNFYTESTE